MRASPAAALVVALVAGACNLGQSSPSPSGSVFAFGDPRDALDLPAAAPADPDDMRPAAGGGVILEPTSAPIEHGLPYRFNLGHCGLQSAVDLDGSFWNAVDVVDASGGPVDPESDPELINPTGGVVIVVDDEAFFRTESGSVVTFTRHDGEKEFPLCM